MSETTTEQLIESKDKTAPRITEHDVESKICITEFHVFQNKQTVCCLTLKNGFTVIGESACVSPENYDPEIGQKIAKENAVNRIWELEGYLLQEKLSQ